MERNHKCDETNPSGIIKDKKTKKTTRRSVAEKMTMHGSTWKEMKKAVNNRVRWRSVVWPCVLRGAERTNSPWTNADIC